jgi:hypothetical protein
MSLENIVAVKARKEFVVQTEASADTNTQAQPKDEGRTQAKDEGRAQAKDEEPASLFPKNEKEVRGLRRWNAEVN